MTQGSRTGPFSWLPGGAHCGAPSRVQASYFDEEVQLTTLRPCTCQWGLVTCQRHLQLTVPSCRGDGSVAKWRFSSSSTAFCLANSSAVWASTFCTWRWHWGEYIAVYRLFMMSELRIKPVHGIVHNCRNHEHA